jgi:hypothetical protein
MDARRAVRSGRGDEAATTAARRAVDQAKRALGERGPVWWSDGAPDLNRRLVKNSPYSDWWRDKLAIVVNGRFNCVWEDPMPKKKLANQAEQSKQFKKDAQKLIDGGQLDPIEAEALLDLTVNRNNPS